MKTSARNNFSGKVVGLKKGAVNDEVEVEIAGGQRLVAVVTHGSVERLGLAVGKEVFALIKASSIIINSDEAGVMFSARNHLTGTVAQLQRGAVNTDVVLELEGGGQIAAVITNESSSALGLSEGSTAHAICKASSVILGVRD